MFLLENFNFLMKNLMKINIFLIFVCLSVQQFHKHNPTHTKHRSHYTSTQLKSDTIPTTKTIEKPHQHINNNTNKPKPNPHRITNHSDHFVPTKTLVITKESPTITKIRLINPNIQNSNHNLNINEQIIDKDHPIKSITPTLTHSRIMNDNDEILKGQTNRCSEENCEKCWENLPNVCLHCKHGSFLYNNSCGNVCPQNYVADIYFRTCRVLIESSKFNTNIDIGKQITFEKAFTIGSCRNRCNQGISHDCK